MVLLCDRDSDVVSDHVAQLAFPFLPNVSWCHQHDSICNRGRLNRSLAPRIGQQRPDELDNKKFGGEVDQLAGLSSDSLAVTLTPDHDSR